uniref:Enhancer of yellow 2 transcription factor n=1 Tax=Timema tahoe TaxID=61484 RepID=A0A7R9NU24_9NEOP|nr:unnamed protein product [Timema tahoe]
MEKELTSVQSTMKRHHEEEAAQGVKTTQRPMAQKKGRVTAISHVLNSKAYFVHIVTYSRKRGGTGVHEVVERWEEQITKQSGHGSKVFFLELFTDPQDVLHVASSLESQAVWLTQINIDSSYCFTHLQPRQIVFKFQTPNIPMSAVPDTQHPLSAVPDTQHPANCQVFFHRTEASSWFGKPVKYLSALKLKKAALSKSMIVTISFPMSNPTLKCRQGYVTDVFRPLAMFQLDNKLNFCTAMMMKVSDVPQLCVGQRVIVYNVHCVSRDLMMCARSRVSIVPHPEQSVPAGVPGREAEKYLPLIDLSNELRLSFRDILWLKKQFHILEEKFDEKAFHNQLLQSLLASIVQWNTLDRELTPVRKLAAEFLEHKLCDLDKESMYYQDLLNVSQVSQLGIPELGNWFWNSNLWDGSEEGPEHSQLPLVGYLSSSNGYWMLSDETGSLPCIITGLSADKWHNNIKALSGNIVVIAKFQLIQEVFQVSKYTYLHFSAKDCRPFNLQNNYPTLDSLCSMCEGIQGYTHSCPKGSIRLNPEPGPSSGDSRPDHMSCDQRECETQRSGQELRPQHTNESSGQRLRLGLDCETNSLEVVVHHLSHLMVVSKGAMTTCHMLATITKRNMETWQNSNTLHVDVSQSNRSKRVVLLLKGPLLRSVPLIQTGALYHLHTAEANNLFINSNHINNFSKEMKTSGLGTVPQDATFIHRGAPLARRDYYRQSEIPTLPYNMPIKGNTLLIVGLATNREQDRTEHITSPVSDMSLVAKEHTVSPISDMSLVAKEHIASPVSNMSLVAKEHTISDMSLVVSVSEASSCEIGDGLVTVEGIIFDRLHLEPQFPSELRSVETAGYGVPGRKSIVVKIRDIASAVSVCVYINRWYQRAYPIGLILGAHVALTNLQQKMSDKTSVYFLTSGISSVVVKDMNQPPHFESKEDWGAPCNLLMAVPSKKLLWGTVEMDQLLKVSIQFKCEYCSQPFIRGKCSYVGCWARSMGEITAVCTWDGMETWVNILWDSLVVVSIVENSRKGGNFKAHHADKEALVIVKGDNVRVVLDMSENQWCQLKLLAKQTGELVYLRGSVAPPGISTDRAKLAFWLFCKVVVANQLKLLHIKVKKYPATPADQTKNIPVLCCVDIKEDRPKILNSFTPQERSLYSRRTWFPGFKWQPQGAQDLPLLTGPLAWFLDRTSDIDFALKTLLRERLVECGWKDQMHMLCRQIVKERGVDIKVDELLAEITPKARASVPDSVKKELLQKIKIQLTQDARSRV